MKGTLDVLIVDDDQNMRLTLTEILTDDGYDVRVASTGEEAVELCNDHIFRLILMDVRMPGMDGLEAYRQIRKRCRRSQIVLMSAYANPELERIALQEGVLAFLTKPLDLESIVRLIAKVTTTAVVYVGTTMGNERLLHDALAQSRFRATFVASPDQALALTEQINYDVIVLDLEGVPDPARAFASLQGPHPATPIILATSATGPSAEHGRDAAVQGAYAVLPKPFASEALISLLEQIKREYRPTKSE